jgi:hypothetical protein
MELEEVEAETADVDSADEEAMKWLLSSPEDSDAEPLAKGNASASSAAPTTTKAASSFWLTTKTGEKLKVEILWCKICCASSKDLGWVKHW